MQSPKAQAPALVNVMDNTPLLLEKIEVDVQGLRPLPTDGH